MNTSRSNDYVAFAPSGSWRPNTDTTRASLAKRNAVRVTEGSLLARVRLPRWQHRRSALLAQAARGLWACLAWCGPNAPRGSPVDARII